MFLFLDSNDKATSSLQNINGNSESQQTGSKQDNLPAYCNPPNPCPIGYSGELFKLYVFLLLKEYNNLFFLKVEDGCLEDFENTAAFSREYQARQDCMCDSEHMFDCTNPRNSDGITQSDLDRLVQQFHVS